MNTAKTQDVIGSSVTRGSSQSEQMSVSGRYRAECLDAQGNVKWVEEFDNLVTTQGKKHLLDWGLTGTASAVAIRMSLLTSALTVVDTATYTAPGTTAVEITATGIVTGNARSTPTLATTTPASGTTGGAAAKATSSATTFNIGGTATITGVSIVLTTAAVTTLGTVADTAQSGGILYSAGLFATAKSVSSGDTLNVTYTTTLT